MLFETIVLLQIVNLVCQLRKIILVCHFIFKKRDQSLASNHFLSFFFSEFLNGLAEPADGVLVFEGRHIVRNSFPQSACLVFLSLRHFSGKIEHRS